MSTSKRFELDVDVFSLSMHQIRNVSEQLSIEDKDALLSSSGASTTYLEYKTALSSQVPSLPSDKLSTIMTSRSELGISIAQSICLLDVISDGSSYIQSDINNDSKADTTTPIELSIYSNLGESASQRGILDPTSSLLTTTQKTLQPTMSQTELPQPTILQTGIAVSLPPQPGKVFDDQHENPGEPIPPIGPGGPSIYSPYIEQPGIPPKMPLVSASQPYDKKESRYSGFYEFAKEVGETIGGSYCACINIHNTHVHMRFNDRKAQNDRIDD